MSVVVIKLLLVKKHAFPDVSSWKASSDLTGNGNRHLLSYDV